MPENERAMLGEERAAPCERPAPDAEAGALEPDARRPEVLRRLPHLVALVAVLPALVAEVAGPDASPGLSTALLALLVLANGLALGAGDRWPRSLPAALHLANALANLELAWRLTLEGKRGVQVLHFLAGVLFLAVALRAWRKARRTAESASPGGR